MPIELILPHHSLADWDWQAGLSHTLDNTVKVVDPSSVRLQGALTNNYYAALCRRSNCQLIPEVQIDTYLRSVDMLESRPIITVSNQAPLGSAAIQNCYFLMFRGDISLVKCVAGGWVLLQWWAWGAESDTWHRYRFTSWVTNGTLNFRIERYDAGEFVWVEPDALDPTPPWLLSPVNRCGVGLYNRALTEDVWFDETYVYGPTM